MKQRKLTIRVRRDSRMALQDLGKEFVNTWNTGKSPGDILQFDSPSALFRTLTPKRWELIECLQGIGPVSLRALARELERDVKRVHDDLAKLIERSLIERTADGKIHVPYNVVHADFDFRAVA